MRGGCERGWCDEENYGTDHNGGRGDGGSSQDDDADGDVLFGSNGDGNLEVSEL